MATAITAKKSEKVIPIFSKKAFEEHFEELYLYCQCSTAFDEMEDRHPVYMRVEDIKRDTIILSLQLRFPDIDLPDYADRLFITIYFPGYAKPEIYFSMPDMKHLIKAESINRKWQFPALGLPKKWTLVLFERMYDYAYLRVFLVHEIENNYRDSRKWLGY
ncbi:hypothetical protein J5X98_01630 [Leptothermofonsia sichuanensis E412]|uniref:hypothetical protein n=1 Tax=Leptothermofonsia sichuanensis TaxID=2917832 RepID=UPI001CA73FF1|nr:hypothetical protein [Leptothermofonsia sichuanensis]QZZ21229.1 hypothetical protein J5X98_01630 [Leptothermofonsia sichuanensis E412]